MPCVVQTQRRCDSLNLHASTADIDNANAEAPRLTPSQRRALESLAASGHIGATREGMLAGSLKLATFPRLSATGSSPQRMKASNETVEVKADAPVGRESY